MLPCSTCHLPAQCFSRGSRPGAGGSAAEWGCHIRRRCCLCMDCGLDRSVLCTQHAAATTTAGGMICLLVLPIAYSQMFRRANQQFGDGQCSSALVLLLAIVGQPSSTAREAL